MAHPGAAPARHRAAAAEARRHAAVRPGAAPARQRAATAERRGHAAARSAAVGAAAGAAAGGTAVQLQRGGVRERRSVANVRMTGEQRSRLHELVTSGSIHSLGHVNFNVAVGTVVPSTVALLPVPPGIVDIVPEYAGFFYFVTGYELVLVDPVTLEIVAVVPV